MKLKGRKIACFSGMPSHVRFFLNIREKIVSHGGNFLFVVPLSEYPLELEVVRQKLPFRYFTDYMNDEVREKTNDSVRRMLAEWTVACHKWDGFSRWPIFKQSWFFEGVIEEYFCMERFFEVEKPDLFLTHHECNRWGKVIGHLARKNGVPLVTFQEGDYHTWIPSYMVHTEYSTADLLWGKMTIDSLAEYGSSPDKMFPIGNTHIDGALKEYAPTEAAAKIRKELNIPSEKKVIFFFTDILYGGSANKDLWSRILSGIECLQDNAVCIFKWHPLVFKGAYDEIEKIFGELLPSAIMLHTYDPYKLLSISDYCVTFGSTTLAVEALAFGKPLFSYPNVDIASDFYVTTLGVAQTIYPPGNWSNLLETMKNGVPSHIQANVDKFLDDYFYKLDGKSVDRAVDIISYIIDVSVQKAKGKGPRPANNKTNIAGRVSYIVPSGNDAEALLATLTSLSQNVKYQDWEVIVVLTDENIRGMLSGMSGDIKIIEESSDLLSVLYNRGADASTGEFLIFLRPGIVYFKDEGLIEGMREGIAGIPLKNRDMTPYCLGIGYDFNSVPYFIKEELTVEAQCSTFNACRGAVGGGFIAMKRGIFEVLGGFDEELANHLIEPDLCLKAKETNMPVRYLADCLAFNYKETFFGKDLSDNEWKNRVRFFAKWLGKLPKDEDFLKFAGDLLKV
jgi:hypothetical protein